MFYIEKTEPSSLGYLRAMHLKELKGPVLDGIEEGIITYKADFVRIANEGTDAGYACIGTDKYYKDNILEYYLKDDYRSRSGEVLKQLAEAYGCKGWFVNTRDFLALPVMLDLRLNYEIDAYIFAIDEERAVDYKLESNITFGIVKINELHEIYELIMQDGFYSGGNIETVAVLIEEEGIYSLRSDGRLIGVGFVGVLKRTPAYADIAMIIDAGERHKGWGILLVKALIHQSRLRKVIPTTLCDVDNVVSRKTLERAGFHLEGCLLLAHI